MSVPITPSTKIGALLEAYPALEPVLVEMVPAFARLRNPVLRRTVAKVATLEEAAAIAGMSVRDLVVKLRRSCGQEVPENLSAVAAPDVPSSALACGPGAACAPMDGPAVQPPAAAPEPDWVRTSRVTLHLDADQMLQQGEHPFGRLSAHASGLGVGEMVRLTSSFYPAPLVQEMARRGLRVHSAAADGGFATHISRG
jgi:hypothetical protein